MAGVFDVMQIVGVVYYALDVALIVAHFHCRFKDIVHCSIDECYQVVSL